MSRRKQVGAGGGSLALSPDEIELARANGGLTFSPRARGRLVCNQAPRLGRISPRHVDGLRCQVCPKKRRAQENSLKVPKVVLTVHQSLLDGTTCPYCRKYNNPVFIGRNVCGKCNTVFNVIAASTAGRRYLHSSFSDDQTEFGSSEKAMAFWSR